MKKFPKTLPQIELPPPEATFENKIGTIEWLNELTEEGIDSIFRKNGTSVALTLPDGNRIYISSGPVQVDDENAFACFTGKELILLIRMAQKKYDLAEAVMTMANVKHVFRGAEIAGFQRYP